MAARTELTVVSSWNDMLLVPGEVELPTDPERLFGREGPLAVEIGFGSGLFLDWLAETRPDWNLLGAEISPACHRRAFQRLREAERRNVRLFKGTGEFLVREVLPAESVRRVYVNFPDPWPKQKHRERRLLTTDFFRVLGGRLESEGSLRLTTDHPDYFRWAVDQAEERSDWAVAVGEPPADFLKTKYAQKWRERGRDFHHARFECVGEPERVSRKIERVDRMHHVKLHGFLPREFGEFDRDVRRFDDGIAAVVDTYAGVGEPRVLCLVHVEEPDLTQRILVEASVGREVEDGREITVRIRRFNEPLMTRGTSEAVEHVADWLADMDERNRIVERRN